MSREIQRESDVTKDTLTHVQTLVTIHKLLKSCVRKSCVVWLFHLTTCNKLVGTIITVCSQGCSKFYDVTILVMAKGDGREVVFQDGGCFLKFLKREQINNQTIIAFLNCG